MKKLISLALCLAMVLTIFTINASALVETSETVVSGGSAEVVYANQDYSDVVNNPDFATFEDGVGANGAGTFEVKDGIITATSTANYQMFAAGPITSPQYIIEFDIRKESGYTSTANGDLVIYGQRGKLSDSANSVYRLMLSPQYLETGVWYTYRIAIDETQYVANASGNVELGLVTSAGYKLASAEQFNDISVSPSGTPNAINKMRTRTTSAMSVDGEIVFKQAANMALSYDNIKVYTPAVAGVETTVGYPINAGNIVMTEKGVTEYVPNNIVTNAATMDKVDFSYGTGAATGGQLVILVDLNNTVAGMPISVAASSTGTAYGNIFSTHIMSNADIVGDWYTYKILFNAATNRATAVYRRPAEGGEWTALVLGTDYIQGTKDDRFGTYKPDAAKAAIGYSGPMSSNLVTGTTVADTRWASRNLQVIDGYAFAGTKTIADGKITLNLNTGIYGAASAILAVYDGNKLANVTPVDLAATAETIEVAADYAEGNKVVLYVWDSLANAKPIMLTPYTVVE